MADFNQPTLTSLYADMVNVLKDRDISALKWLDGTTDSNIPSGAKRWNATNNYFEKFNGSTWSVLTAKYMIDVDKVDGCTVNDLGTSTTDLWTASKVNTALSTKLDASAYTAADVLTKIKTVDGSSSGLDADLLDGLHASSANTVSTVVARDASGNFSAGTITANLTGTASTATTLTGLTSTVAELNFTDGVTSNIQTQLNGKLGSTAKATDSALLNGVAEATTATANTVVKRDASGYIYATAFNSTLADTATAATHYYVETNSDGWLRPKTLANVKAELLASAALTGTPTAPTAVAGTNTTQVATTEFVLANSVQDADFAKSLAANGYTKLPNGLIIQWGSASVATRSNNVKINLPIAFPNAALFAIAGAKGINNLFNGGEAITSWSTTQIGVSTYDGTALTWIAIGY